MLNVGDKLICKTEGQPETEFCIRGEVKKVEGDIRPSAVRLNSERCPCTRI